MKKNKTILITFDVEEFDTPLLHNINISAEEQMEVGHEGLLNIITLLDELNQPCCTFYTTAAFALHFQETIRNISTHHEIASHTFHHSKFTPKDIADSKICLEKIIGKEIYGFRMPNMADFDKSLIAKAGYRYDSSINPTYLPGKYNYLKYPISPFQYHDTIEIPASVLPYIRLPLFWLTFKNFPLGLYIRLCNITLAKTGFLNLYFHPWEFAQLDAYAVPGFIKNPNGMMLIDKLRTLFQYYQSKPDVTFKKTINFYHDIKDNIKYAQNP